MRFHHPGTGETPASPPSSSSNANTNTNTNADTSATPTSRVYVYQDGDAAPPHPGPLWTRFVCISDTHSRRFTVPPGDVLLHAGDLSSWGCSSQLKTTVEWLKTLQHPTKVIIAGNHDLCLDPDITKHYPFVLDKKTPPEGPQALVRGKDVRDKDIIYLEHESCVIETESGREWKVYGSPAAPIYAQGAFQYASDREADETYQRVPEDVEILMTHTPPHDVLDLSKSGTHAGCRRLAARMKDLGRCRLHVFGHIHEAHGAVVLRGDRVAVNAALGSKDRKPVVVDLLN